MDFLLGVLSSLIASLIFVKVSKMSVRWRRAFPKGVQFIVPDREAYLRRIAKLIRNNKNVFFFKGFTGYDLFSSELIKEALEEKRIDNCKECNFIFTDPSSNGFSAEPNKYYTPDRLKPMQQAATDFIRNRILACFPSDSKAKRGIFYINEDNNIFNLLILDSEAYFFFRGFTQHQGATGQVIINVDLLRCPELIKALVDYIKNYYLERSGDALIPVSAITVEPPNKSLDVRAKQ